MSIYARDQQLPLEKRRVLLRIWFAGLVISLLMPVAGYWLGRVWDCKPGQVDGLCGMSTFFILGILYFMIFSSLDLNSGFRLRLLLLLISE